MSPKTAVNSVSRAVYGRKRFYSSLAVQRRSFLTSVVSREASETEATPLKRIPIVREWDGIVISPTITKGKNHRFRLDPAKPIRSESEFQKNTLSRDLAAQHVKSREKLPPNRLPSKKEEISEKEEKKEEVGIQTDSLDVGSIIRRTGNPDRQRPNGQKQDRQRQNRTSISRDVDAADAALQSFQGERSLQNPAVQRSRQAKGKSIMNVTRTSGAKIQSSPKISRRQKLDTEDEAKATFENVSFDEHPPPSTSRFQSDTTLMRTFDGDNFAVETPFKLQTPDSDTLTFESGKYETSIPSEPLTILNPQFFLDFDVDTQMQKYVGRYDTHFGAQDWKLVDKLKSGGILSPIEYAILTIGHNRTLGTKKKKQSVNVIERVLQRNSSSALANSSEKSSKL